MPPPAETLQGLWQEIPGPPVKSKPLDRALCRHVLAFTNCHQSGRFVLWAWKSTVASTPMKLVWSEFRTNEPYRMKLPVFVLHANVLFCAPLSDVHASQEKLTPAAHERSAKARQAMSKRRGRMARMGI